MNILIAPNETYVMPGLAMPFRQHAAGTFPTFDLLFGNTGVASFAFSDQIHCL